MGQGALVSALGPAAVRCSGSLPEIGPTNRDELVLASGLRYRVLVCEGDRISSGARGDLRFGSNNDFIAFFAGPDADRALLWVNHEMPCGLFDGERVFWIPRTRTEFERSRASVGGSCIAIERESSGQWSLAANHDQNFRLDAASPITLSRPIGGTTKAEGTLGNCAGGVTPWGTLLTCEENHLYYFGDTRWSGGRREVFYEPRDHKRLDWHRFRPNNPDHYGWVVEVNLETGVAQKQIALGRCFHECARVAPARDRSGRVAVYSGDDTIGGCIYKFLSRDANSLAEGELYAANTRTGRWEMLDVARPELREFNTQLNVLIHARQAALLAGATPQDRPEDIELDPSDGSVYISLTNNTRREPPNYHGSILKLIEAGGDPFALQFTTRTFFTGGEKFSCPDNMAFDPRGNLWLASDISEHDRETAPYQSFGNNGLFYIPLHGPDSGAVFQMGSAPTDAEFTGLRFAPDGRTLFLSVQHPGARTRARNNPTSRWPDGDFPRSAVVTIGGPTLDALAAV